MRDRTRPHATWRASAIVCALLACLLPALARLVAGPRGADVHVEWRPSVDEATRLQLETRYKLADPRKLEDTYTWRYDLTDPSFENIRALVTDAAVEDTHEIDRNRYTVEPTAPRTMRRQRFTSAGDTMVGIADGVAIALLILAGVTAATRSAPGALLQRGIPELQASTAGLFRILFGLIALVFFATHRVDASWLDRTFDLEIDGPLHAAIVEWLRGRPAIVNGLYPWLIATGAAFTVGLFTRLTYGLFVAGAIVWAYVAMSTSSTHPFSPYILALVAFLPSHWGDAISVDAWMRRARGATRALPPGRHYGYSVWVPGLVFATGFAAAAWAKLSVPPGWTDWILNGTVKYHFITDSINAPVTWGLQLARYPLLAILASFFAVATEGLLITTAFTRSERYRLTLGAAALALLAGFPLFMGVFWPAWWILPLGFLPWERLGRYVDGLLGRTAALATVLRPRMATATQVVFIAIILAQQIVVSGLKLERAPMFSWYDMYSGTYASPAAWSASRSPNYRIVVATDAGNVELASCNPHGEFVREFEAAVKGSGKATSSVWHELSGCGLDLGTAHQVTLEGDVSTFDWDRLVFVTSRSNVILGPLASAHSPSPAIPDAGPASTGRVEAGAAPPVGAGS